MFRFALCQMFVFSTAAIVSHAAPMLLMQFESFATFQLSPFLAELQANQDVHAQNAISSFGILWQGYLKQMFFVVCLE